MTWARDDADCNGKALWLATSEIKMQAIDIKHHNSVFVESEIRFANLAAIVIDDHGHTYHGELVRVETDVLAAVRRCIGTDGHHFIDGRGEGPSWIGTVRRFTTNALHSGRLSWVGPMRASAGNFEESYHKARFRPDFREIR